MAAAYRSRVRCSRGRSCCGHCRSSSRGDFQEIERYIIIPIEKDHNAVPLNFF
uniref:Candidate secreted effector n=1 Tax=Meloidogyne incognita TaxID=6306 RepID=A0A914KKK4_MELIC